MQDALNTQLQRELAASYLYLSMAAWFEGCNLPGFAHWMRLQQQEEMTHAMKFFDMLVNREGHVQLGALEAPPAAFESTLDVMQQALVHEQQVTAAIHEIYAAALRENDYTTQAQLQWFITEQVEEEKTLQQIIDQIKLAGGQGSGMLLIDQQLAGRVVAA
jgi:ferritin